MNSRKMPDNAPASWESNIRLLLNILCTEKLRQQFVTALSDRTVTGIIKNLSFMDESGLVEDEVFKLRKALNTALEPESEFNRSPLELPTQSTDRLNISKLACHTAFKRAGWKYCSEAELTAALSQLVDDPALARRDCVDSGFLIRDAAGTRYRLARPIEE